jgi:hypothetical protein
LILGQFLTAFETRQIFLSKFYLCFCAAWFLLDAGMGISQIVTALTVLVTGFLPASCTKIALPKTPTPTVATTGTNGIRDLGEVTLTNHYETCVHLGGGKNFTLTPKMIDSHQIELTLSLESKTPAGKTHDLSVTQVEAESGKPLEIVVGDFQLSLTPKITSE